MVKESTQTPHLVIHGMLASVSNSIVRNNEIESLNAQNASNHSSPNYISLSFPSLLCLLLAWIDESVSLHQAPQLLDDLVSSYTCTYGEV